MSKVSKLAPKSLMKQRKFLPLFITQFQGAFSDNLFRNALIVLVTFKLSAGSLPADPKILSSIAAALLVAPYIFFSSLAGKMADKFERSRLMRYTKIFEIFVMLFAAYGFYTNNIVLLLCLLFGAGLQATFFSPMKYSVLPTHLRKDELIKGNGLIESGTFLAILTGNIAGNTLGGFVDVNSPMSSFIISGTLVFLSACGIVSAYFIPVAHAAEPKLKITPNLFKSSYLIVKSVMADKIVFRAIIFTSWFWLCGSVFLSLLPGYVKETLHTNDKLYTIFLTAFSIGIAIGAVACGKILNNRITAKYTHLSLFGVALFTLTMVGLGSFAVAAPDGTLQNVSGFFSNWYAIPMLLSMVATTFCWGIYSVPLKTIIQHESKEAERSRIIAGENIFNATFMVLANIICGALIYSGFTIVMIFTTIGIINIFVGIMALKIWKE